MQSPPSHPSGPASFPRAGVDPITDEVCAFGLVASQIHRPLRPETVCVFLDHAYRGVAFVIVTDTTQPDDVVEVVTRLVEIPSCHVGALAVASVRPGADRLDFDDADRWIAIDRIAEQRSIELLDWWVIGARVMQPANELGEPSRWPSNR